MRKSTTRMLMRHTVIVVTRSKENESFSVNKG